MRLFIIFGVLLVNTGLLIIFTNIISGLALKQPAFLLNGVPTLKILVTGITGFAGSHLAQYLISTKNTVAGLSLSASLEEFSQLFEKKTPTVHQCDLSDTIKLTSLLEEEKPDAVIHLAAHSQAAGAWKKAAEILETNIVGTQNLMSAVFEAAPGARILLVSSGEVYGSVSPGELPLREDGKLMPNNPYAVSKLAQEYVCLQYHEAFATEVVIARPFNHLGPRQTGDFVVPSFARQIAEIEAGLREPVLLVGNLDSERDFTDVRDTVKAYLVALTKGEPGEINNVASGNPVRIREVLDILLELSRVRPEVKNNPELMRPSDTPVIYGDSSKLRSLARWQPEITLEQSLLDTLNYWRTRVAARVSNA